MLGLRSEAPWQRAPAPIGAAIEAASAGIVTAITMPTPAVAGRRLRPVPVAVSADPGPGAAQRRNDSGN
jgi:hypothetical protein